MWDKKRPNTEENPMREPLTDVAKELCNYFDGDEIKTCNIKTSDELRIKMQ